jgi:type IV secretory pathway TrbD component
MFRTSTFFIKAQNPAASVPLLLNFYQQELEYQRVHHVTVSEDAVYFHNRPWAIGTARPGSQYFCFSSGRIRIQDTGNEYEVFLEGNLSRIMRIGGILAAICILAAFITAGLNWIAVGLGLIIFFLVSIVNYVYTLLFFPIYFTDLRNEMEESLQNLS